MDPYETSSTSSVPGDSPMGSGKACAECGSTNTGTPQAYLRKRPSIVGLLLFNWLFMLISIAFSMKSVVCRDCGATRRYKSVGSWIALVILLLLAGMIALVALRTTRHR